MSSGANNPANTPATGSTTGNRPWYETIGAMFKPNLSLGGIFSGLFWAAIFAGIAYVVLKNSSGLRDMIEERFPMVAAGLEGLLGRMGLSLFPDAMEDTLRNRSANETIDGKDSVRALLQSQLDDALDPLIEVITADDATKNRFLDLVKSANGSVTKDAFMSDKTLFALMQQEPQLARRLIAALPTGKSTNEASSAVLNAVRSMAGDGRLAQLLAQPESRLTLAHALAKQCAPIRIDPAALADYLAATALDANGQLTEGFRQFIDTALAAETNAHQSAIQLILAHMGTHPEATQRLLHGLDLTSIEDAKTQQLLTNLKKLDAAGFRAIAGILQTNPEAAQIIASGDETRITAYLANHPQLAQQIADQTPQLLTSGQRDGLRLIAEANPSARRAIAQLSNAGVDLANEQRLIAAQDGDATTITGKDMVMFLMDSDNRARFYEKDGHNHLGALGNALRGSGLSGTHVGFLTFVDEHNKYPNISALFNLASDLDASNPQESGRRATTTKIVGALQHLVEHPSEGAEAFKDITAKELSSFFGNVDNRAALERFFTRLRPDAFPAGSRERQILTTLKAEWPSLAAVLSDNQADRPFGSSAEQLLEALKGNGTGMSLNPGGTRAFVLLDDTLRENLASMLRIQEALGTPATATPRTTIATNSVQR